MIPLTVPELGLPPDEPIMISCWLVRRGENVVAGDRVVELLIGEITFDVAAPASGRLADIQVRVDEPVRPGAILGHLVP